MENKDYPKVYSIIPVYDIDKNKEKYGYVACGCYLLKELLINKEDGTSIKKYEVVCDIKEKDLTLNSYETIESQIPTFEAGKCNNSIIVDEIYEMYDIAKEASEKMNMELFEKMAKEENYPPPSHLKTIVDLKRAIDIRKSKLSERLTELIIVEKSLNHQNRTYR